MSEPNKALPELPEPCSEVFAANGEGYDFLTPGKCYYTPDQMREYALRALASSEQGEVVVWEYWYKQPHADGAVYMSRFKPTDERVECRPLYAHPPTAATPGEDGVRAMTPAEEAEVDEAIGLAKITFRLPIDLLGEIDHRAQQEGLVRPAKIRMLLAEAMSSGNAVPSELKNKIHVLHDALWTATNWPDQQADADKDASDFIKYHGMEVVAAIAATQPEQVRDAWLPIDSAPKDALILVVDEFAEICLGRHSTGKYFQTANVDGGRDDYSEPTHWQPLPTLPPANARVFINDYELAIPNAEIAHAIVNDMLSTSPHEGVDDKMVERSAKALNVVDDCCFTPWDELPEYGKDRYRDKARSALTAAMTERPIATEAMVDRAMAASDKTFNDSIRLATHDNKTTPRECMRAALTAALREPRA